MGLVVGCVEASGCVLRRRYGIAGIGIRAGAVGLTMQAVGGAASTLPDLNTIPFATLNKPPSVLVPSGDSRSKPMLVRSRALRPSHVYDPLHVRHFVAQLAMIRILPTPFNCFAKRIFAGKAICVL
jgi:hypothetical protein